jgi:hypothetical protein
VPLVTDILPEGGVGPKYYELPGHTRTWQIPIRSCGERLESFSIKETDFSVVGTSATPEDTGFGALNHSILATITPTGNACDGREYRQIPGECSLTAFCVWGFRLSRKRNPPAVRSPIRILSARERRQGATVF